MRSFSKSHRAGLLACLLGLIATPAPGQLHSTAIPTGIVNPTPVGLPHGLPGPNPQPGDRISLPGWTLTLLPAGYEALQASRDGSVVLLRRADGANYDPYALNEYFRWSAGSMEKLGLGSLASMNNLGAIAMNVARESPGGGRTLQIMEAWQPAEKSFGFGFTPPRYAHFHEAGYNSPASIEYEQGASLVQFDDQNRAWVRTTDGVEIWTYESGEPVRQTISSPSANRVSPLGAYDFARTNAHWTSVSRTGHWGLSYYDSQAISPDFQVDGIAVESEPFFINDNGVALLRGGAPSGPNGATIIRYASGAQEPAPGYPAPAAFGAYVISGQAAWIDGQDRLGGYKILTAPATQTAPEQWIPALLARKQGSDGSLLSPAAYDVLPCEPMVLPAEWTTDHRVARDTTTPQLGIAVNTATAVHRPFVAIPQPVLPGLAVDANRDGQIKLPEEDDSDATSPNHPFRFWINDDDDGGDTQGSDIPMPDSTDAADTGFSKDGSVDGARDLVDFFPVFLNLKQTLTILPPSASVKYKLKQADNAVNFAYTKLNRADALKYQTEDKGEIFGFDLDKAIAKAETRRVIAEGVELSDRFLTGIKDQDWGVILIEGRSATNKPLVLSVEKDGAAIAEIKLELSIGSVEDMYRRINFRDGGDAPAGLVGDLSVRDNDLGKPTSLSEPINFPDSQTNGKWFVFVVGSNVGGQRMRGWQSETFKRMYWSRFRARFVGVSWYGDPYSDGNDLLYDYHSAARNAFATASKLAEKINALPGNKTIAGHSAAALMISSAIADHGLNVSKACLIDAAMARECFDGNSADDIIGMVPAIWRDYPAGYWASHWHEAFSTIDARSTLTWRNRFSGAAGVVHNFYSSTEDVLGRYEGTVNGSIIENVRSPGSFAWVIQEKAKGDKLKIGLFIHAGSDYGGWGFNLNDPITSNLPTWYVTNNNAQRVTKTPEQVGPITVQMLNDIKIQPLFKTGWGRYFYGNPVPVVVDTNSANNTGPSWIFDLYGVSSGSSVAADPAKRAQLLNEAMPALSLAVGSNFTDRFGDTRNYDMPSLYADPNRWPTARGSSVNGVPLWHHSDMREIAYTYFYKLFDKLSALSNE